MLTPLYIGESGVLERKMSYRIQSSTVTAPQRKATRPRACKDAREQNSFNVHKKNEKENISRTFTPVGTDGDAKYTETHKRAQKKGQRGAKRGQKQPRATTERVCGDRWVAARAARDQAGSGFKKRFEEGDTKEGNETVMSTHEGFTSR
jgi:hypothetical protein